MVEVESMANQGHISRPGAWCDRGLKRRSALVTSRVSNGISIATWLMRVRMHARVRVQPFLGSVTI